VTTTAETPVDVEFTYMPGRLGRSVATVEVCSSCLHWERQTNLGSCSHTAFRRGYHIDTADVGRDEVLVEDDEGWGFLTGPDFGCVHWKGNAN